MLKIAFVAVVALPLAACATTPSSSELAYCQQMERRMGTDQAHDHAQSKGMGLESMNVSHARCREILGNS